MKRIAFIFSLLILCQSHALAKAALKITWFGTTCLNISDGSTSIFFDPFLNRPSLWEILSLSHYKNDPAVVSKWLSKINKDQIKGIFISHTHYDHALDLALVAKQTPAMTYGSPSALKILVGSKISASRFKKITDFEEYKLGDFKVKILPGLHPPHLLGFTIGSGPIEKPLPAHSPIYKYKMGESFNFYIEHPLGNILFHPSSQTVIKKSVLKKLPADLVIQGIYSRKSTKAIIDNILGPVGATQVIPVHYDDLFTSLNEGSKPMIKSGIEEFRKTFKKLPGYKAHNLELGKPFSYNSKN